MFTSQGIHLGLQSYNAVLRGLGTSALEIQGRRKAISGFLSRLRAQFHLM
jgi:hypothetical protein